MEALLFAISFANSPPAPPLMTPPDEDPDVVGAFRSIGGGAYVRTAA